MTPAELQAAVALFASAYAVTVGLLAGSFVNLAADRVPRGQSLVRPRSHCRGCNRRLNAVDLIPVGGYFIRRGRCATCGVAIGAASPAVEGACGGIMLVAVIGLGLWPGAAIGALGVAGFGLIVIVTAARRARPAP